jgi:hypothetical protein
MNAVVVLIGCLALISAAVTPASGQDGKSLDSFIETGVISEEFQRKVLEFEFDTADQAMLQKAFDFSLLREQK